MTRFPRLIFVAAAATVVGLVAYAKLAPAPPGMPEPASGPPRTLVLRAPAHVAAGTAFSVSAGPIGAQAADSVVMSAESAFGSQALRPLVRRRVVTATVPASATAVAGALVVRLEGDLAQARAVVQVRPGASHSPLTPVVGARSIIADGHDRAQIVAIPEDAMGNPTSTGTGVLLRWRHPGGQTGALSLRSRHLVASGWLVSQTAAGRTIVSVSSGTARGAAGDLDEVAGPPGPAGFGVVAAEGSAKADGRGLVRLRTTNLADRFGNEMPDGTEVTFALEGPGTHGRLPSQTLNGVASTVMTAPQRRGTFRVTAWCRGRRSRPARLRFAAAGGPQIPVSIHWRNQTLKVHVGPLLGQLGALVPDGTQVSVAVLGANRAVATRLAVRTVNGVSDALVVPSRSRSARWVRVTVSGRSRVVRTW